MPAQAFDPDKFLAETAPKAQAFDPDQFLAETAPKNPKPSLSPADKAFKVAEDAGSAVLDHPWVKGPLAFVGDKFERYADAPFRAHISELARGGNVYGGAKKAMEQFGEKTLPTTLDAKTLAGGMGVSTTSFSEAAPGLFSDTGEGMKLKRGGIADVSPAGVVGGIAQPSMLALPGEALLSAGGKIARTAAKGTAKVADKFLSPILVTGNAAADLGKKAVFKTGQVMTGGNLDAGKAFAASE